MSSRDVRQFKKRLSKSLKAHPHRLPIVILDTFIEGKSTPIKYLADGLVHIIFFRPLYQPDIIRK